MFELMAKKVAKTDLQIRGIPRELRAKVRRQSERSGQTMSQYVIELIRNAPEQPSVEEWLKMVRSWKPIPVKPGADVAKALREARRIEEGLEP